MAAGVNATNFEVNVNTFLPFPGVDRDQAIPADFVEMLKRPSGAGIDLEEDVHEGNCLQGLVFAFLFEAVGGVTLCLLWHLLKAVH